MIRRSRVVDDAPSSLAIVVARGEGDHGVAVLHGGECVAFLTPAQAIAEAKRLRDMASLARRPGKLPDPEPCSNPYCRTLSTCLVCGKKRRELAA